MAAALPALLAGLLLAGLLTAGAEEAAPSGSPSPAPAGPPSRLKGEIVFVIDLSGSMRIPDQHDPRGEDRAPISRMDAATYEVSETLEGLALRGRYRFDIVLFSRTLKILSKRLGAPSGLLPLDRRHIDAARAFLADAGAAGPTSLRPALSRALSLFPRKGPSGISRSLFLYTDGVPTFSGEKAQNKLQFTEALDDFRHQVREANQAGIKINTFGISATSISRAFLRSLALDNGGISIFLPCR